MDDQALTIRIAAEDDFSPAFGQVQDALVQTSVATEDAAQGFDQLDAATGQTAAGLDDVTRALDDTTGAIDDQLRVLNGPDMQGLADSLSELTAGATAGLSGAQLAGAAGAALGLLLQNPVIRQDLARLNALLQQLITPVAEAIGPSLDALVPLMQEMKPVFVVIGEALRTNLSPLVQEMRLAFQAEQAVVAALKPVADALDGLKQAIENLGSLGLGGGSGGGGWQPPHFSIGGIQIFDAGGVVGSESGPVPAGMPGHRLVLAQVGERLVPPGGDTSGAGTASAFHFHIQASDPRNAAQEIRQVIEELIVTRRLGVA
jgi:hypothetical protein